MSVLTRRSSKIFRETMAMFKTENDKKLESPDELFDLFNDYERLKTYKYDEPTGGSVDMHEFHLELPYNDIK